jgi:Outer membrane protein beta-barrel domain
MKNVLYALFVLFAFALPAFGQSDVEFYGGYQHSSGDQGLDGFNGGIGWSPIPRFQLYVNYDGLYDHSTLGAFELTSVGTTIVNSHMQGLLTGPRYTLPGLFKGSHKIEGKRLVPYLDAGFGEYRLHSELIQANLGTVQAADTAFAWALGGGADWRMLPHWSIRGDLGFLRTHFAASGQGRLRLGLNVVYSFRGRSQ